jgi:hypothetical protein
LGFSHRDLTIYDHALHQAEHFVNGSICTTCSIKRGVERLSIEIEI